MIITLLDAGNNNTIVLGLWIGGIIIGIVIAYYLSLWIFSAVLDKIIRGASRSKKMEWQLRIKTALLAEIAKQQGSPDDESK